MSRPCMGSSFVRRVILHSATVAVICLMGGAVRANAQSYSILTSPTLTGDWGEARTNLKNKGITFDLSYINQYADDFAGGKRQGSDFANQLAAAMTLDLNKIAGISGGSVFVGFNQRWGRSESADYIGSRIADQYLIGGGENLRITNLSYQQNFDNGIIVTQIGDFPMGNTFGTDAVFCNFMSNAFCGHMTAQPSDSNGWSDYPLARWGGRARFQLTPNLYLQSGVFDSNPTDATYPNGLKLSLSGTTGALIPVEVGLTTNFDSLPGHYKVGAYYDTSTIADIAISKRVDTGRYAGYAIFDQMLWSFDANADRGLIVFGSYTHTDSETTAVPQQIVAGLDIQGPFASRPNDFVDFGFTNIKVNRRLINKEYLLLETKNITDFSLEPGENDIEAGYGYKATPWLLLHPNIQYVGNPGAYSYKHIPCAWVFGFETRVTF